MSDRYGRQNHPMLLTALHKWDRNEEYSNIRVHARLVEKDETRSLKDIRDGNPN